MADNDFYAWQMEEEERLRIAEKESDNRQEIHLGDINLVMSQVECTQDEAIMALTKHDGDIVDAIMDLQF